MCFQVKHAMGTHFSGCSRGVPVARAQIAELFTVRTPWGFTEHIQPVAGCAYSGRENFGCHDRGR